MWTFFRAKSRPSLLLLAGLVWGLGLGGCANPAAELGGSLYTPVARGQAVGPVPPPPIPYYPYQPQELKSLDELPAPVHAAAEAHVRARVGEAFYRTLRFAGGQAVDLDALHRVNPASRGFRPEVAAYVVRFDFARPEAGLRRYTATVALRSDGTILRPVDLPAFAKDPAKLTLHPLREVSADLARRGLFDPAATTVTAAYDPAGDTLVWHFEQTLPGRGPEVRTRTVDVDACTGRVLRS